MAFSLALVAAFVPAKVANIPSSQIGHKRSRGHSRPSSPLSLQRELLLKELNPALTWRRVLATKHSMTEPLSSCKRCTSSMISNFTSWASATSPVLLRVTTSHFSGVVTNICKTKQSRKWIDSSRRTQTEQRSSVLVVLEWLVQNVIKECTCHTTVPKQPSVVHQKVKKPQF